MSVMLNRADVFRVHHSLHDGVQTEAAVDAYTDRGR